MSVIAKSLISVNLKCFPSMHLEQGVLSLSPVREAQGEKQMLLRNIMPSEFWPKA